MSGCEAAAWPSAKESVDTELLLEHRTKRELLIQLRLSEWLRVSTEPPVTRSTRKNGQEVVLDRGMRAHRQASDDASLVFKLKRERHEGAAVGAAPLVDAAWLVTIHAGLVLGV